MTRLRALVAVAATLLLFQSASASSGQEMTDLYKAEVSISGTGENERLEGFRAGAEKVFVKLTGRPKLAATDRAKAIFERAPELVAEHSYEDRTGEPAEGEEAVESDPAHFLRIRFDEEKFSSALHDAGIDIWTGKRPTIAVWLGVREVRRRFVLGGDGDDGAAKREILKKAAARRGLSVVLPEADQDTVTYRDIERRQWSLLWNQSKQLGTGTVLFGTLEEAGDDWDAQWIVAGKGAYSKWRQRGLTLEKALTAAVDHVMTAHARHARHLQKD
ncbi:MAG: DUF2066 domain-containing protein [Rhodomicrobiaceae bacterium]